MTPSALLAQILASPEEDAARPLLARSLPHLTPDQQDQLAESLKEAVLAWQPKDVGRALALADLVGCLGQITGDPGHQALGLRLQGVVRLLGLGQYQTALDLYDRAIALYQSQGDPVGPALVEVTRIWALTNLGQTDQALQAGEAAATVLESHGRWRDLATLHNNMAAIYGRLGQDRQSLAMFDRARRAYRQLGPAGDPFLPLTDLNRAIVLRVLGRFDDSISASQAALRAAEALGQTATAARVRQNIGITYFVLGRYNEALTLLDLARDVFLEDGRRRDAILVELFVSDGLLQLRRFQDVLDKCRLVRQRFSELGARFEVAQALLNEAMAFAGLGRYDDARASLAEARDRFLAEGNEVWVTTTDLEEAAVLGHQGQQAASLALAQAVAIQFADHNLVVKEAQANLVAARAALALDRRQEAGRFVAAVLAVAAERDLPSLAYQGLHLRGRLAEWRGDTVAALAAYDRAITQLERLQGRLMVEFRADFLADKTAVYADAVSLSLAAGDAPAGLVYAERAKSRALHDLLVHRLDLRIQARSPADQPLVDQLEALRAERDRLYRRWESRDATVDETGQREAQQAVLAVEGRITQLWHQLLVRNADYAREATLVQVGVEPIQPRLAEGTALVEYFAAGGRLIAFVVTTGELTAHSLPLALPDVQNQLQRLWLNLRAVRRSGAAQLPALAANARGVLQRLYDGLLAPLTARLAGIERLVVVPHGPLHYLPFHALHDRDDYLLRRYRFSYLPGSSFLNVDGRLPSPAPSENVALGYSYHGRLPHTQEEARVVARLLGGRLLLEESASRAAVREAAASCRVLHLAAHGDFRPDNPLFSGLALSDGWLTTLDVFNLPLRASLVTLSGCRTGRSVVAGGDELLGLMRAFLSAGAASLVLTFWAVEDRSTAVLMEQFYRALAAGQSKEAALRAAQLALLDDAQSPYAHPYFWAPFFLVGQTGPLD